MFVTLLQILFILYLTSDLVIGSLCWSRQVFFLALIYENLAGHQFQNRPQTLICNALAPHNSLFEIHYIHFNKTVPQLLSTIIRMAVNHPC